MLQRSDRYYFIAEIGENSKTFHAMLSRETKTFGNKFYWKDGLSWCHSTGFDTFKIIKECGRMPEGENFSEWFDKIYFEFLVTYPPHSITTVEELQQYHGLNGFLSGDGRLYLCHFMEHRALSQKLMIIHYRDEYYKSENDLEFLRSKGWILISGHRFDFDYQNLKPTEAQTNFLKALLEGARLSKAEFLKNQIEEFFELLEAIY